jgi:hypothetical protein
MTMAKDSIVDPAARDKYLLQGAPPSSHLTKYLSHTCHAVTAGPTYSPTTHQEVPVNSATSTCIESPLTTCFLKVRIKDYHGLPHNSPTSSPYFSHKLHTSDRYSIAFSFVPKQNLSGKDVVLGFDYDHSIRHQLPPGFKYAMKIATSMLDPGLYSDAYCDEPYLYGPALSGLFTLNIGERTDKVDAQQQLATLEQQNGGVVEEGAVGSGASIRSAQSLPSKWKKRRKHFLSASALEAFTFEKGRMYHCDFFNPHLDFANFSLRLPGFSISVARYIDEKTHHLRYVLKNRATGEVLFVVFFKLLFGGELEEMLEAKRGEREGRGADGDRSMLRGGGEPGAAEPLPPPPSREEDTSQSQVDSTILSTPHRESIPTEDGADDDPPSDNIATTAATSLSNSIYAAFVAMGLWDEDTGSSSDSEELGSKSSPQPTHHAQIDDMDDSSIERYLQSKQGNVE